MFKVRPSCRWPPLATAHWVVYGPAASTRRHYRAFRWPRGALQTRQELCSGIAFTRHNVCSQARTAYSGKKERGLASIEDSTLRRGDEMWRNITR